MLGRIPDRACKLPPTAPALNAEVASASLGIDRRHRFLIRPAEGMTRAELVHEVLGERDVARRLGC